MVTSTGSGLSVPDWPLSYGMLMPPMIAGIFYEHGHRMIAAAVGLLTVIQAVWLQMREPKRFVRILGWSSLGAVLAQGLLGGLTVLFLLPHSISIAHAGLAEVFLCINVSIAYFTSRGFVDMRKQAAVAEAPAGLTTALLALVYVQILMGALVRHLGAGLAIPDFPLAFGRLVPPMTTAGVAANFAHRTGALLVSLVALATIVATVRSVSPALRRMGVVLAAVVALQIFLGAEVVWSGGNAVYHSLAGQEAMKHAMITSLHVVTGAATLATSLLLALTARTVRKAAPSRAGALVAREVTA